MPALSAEAIAAITALFGVIGGYAMRIYTTRLSYERQTQLSERDLLNHLLDLQQQVVTLSTKTSNYWLKSRDCVGRSVSCSL